MKEQLKVKLDPSKISSDVELFNRSLRKIIVGQEDAVTAMTEIYQLVQSKMHQTGRPLGVFLFLGPTGVGKTRAVEAVAQTLHGDSKRMLKVDCGEFQHSHEIAKLIGSPPGYLGHRETPPYLSTERIHDCWSEKHQITPILFDEIEKASDAVWKLLLGILDKGTLTLGDNKTVQFNRTLIFLTSNLGAREISQLSGDGKVGFAPVEECQEQELKKQTTDVAMEAVRKHFQPEFVNRLDKVVVFNQLTPENMEKILSVELGSIQQRILHATKEKFVFTVSEDVRKKLLKEGFDSRYGARPLKRLLETKIVLPLANLIATEQIISADKIRIELEDGEIVFSSDRSIPPPTEGWEARW